jgi:hypothetical protein
VAGEMWVSTALGVLRERGTYPAARNVRSCCASISSAKSLDLTRIDKMST